MRNAIGSAVRLEYAETRGFRLLHESVNQVNRGRTWLYSGPVASVSHRVNIDPADTSTVCGFRLVKEGT